MAAILAPRWDQVIWFEATNSHPLRLIFQRQWLAGWLNYSGGGRRWRPEQAVYIQVELIRKQWRHRCFTAGARHTTRVHRYSRLQHCQLRTGVKESSQVSALMIYHTNAQQSWRWSGRRQWWLLWTDSNVFKHVYYQILLLSEQIKWCWWDWSCCSADRCH